MEGVTIRTASKPDLEALRLWKNTHRDRFFFKEFITEEMQRKWFESYLDREHDYMLVVTAEGQKIGCLGFRLKDRCVDFYNVILGDSRFSGKGYMTLAFELARVEAGKRYPGLPIVVAVLKDNPALGWYFRRGFAVTKQHDEFFELTYSGTQEEG